MVCNVVCGDGLGEREGGYVFEDGGRADGAAGRVEEGGGCADLDGREGG